jgi:hypothetical protein
MSGCSSKGEDSMKKKELAALSLSIVVIGAVAAFVIIRNPFAQTGTWELFSQVSGAGTRETTEFNMSDRWCVAWSIGNQSTRANYFIVTVYARNDGGFSPIIETDESDTNATEGILPVDYMGSFVIRVVAADDTEWNLRILHLVKST